LPGDNSENEENREWIPREKILKAVSLGDRWRIHLKNFNINIKRPKLISHNYSLK